MLVEHQVSKQQVMCQILPPVNKIQVIFEMIFFLVVDGNYEMSFDIIIKFDGYCSGTKPTTETDVFGITYINIHDL